MSVEWCLRIKKAGWKIYYVPQAQVIHYWYYARARDATHLILTGYYSELYVFKKHYPHWAFLVLRCVEVGELVLRMSTWTLLFFLRPPQRPFFQDRLRVGWQAIKLALTL